ncbi:MAG: hypothetical protein WC849_01470 [Candidatus Paceibacterota bacterium]
MSYKSKKRKKTRASKLQRDFVIFLKKFFVKFSRKIEKFFEIKNKNEENKMRFPQTKIIMEQLREKAKRIRPNNLKINEWIDDYIDSCILEGKQIEIITQYCLSKDLEFRYQKQGNKFVPLPAERNMFEKTIPEIISLFEKNGLTLNWYVTFNDSFLDRGRVSSDIKSIYMCMIKNLAEEIKSLEQSIIFLDWELDVLGKQSGPNMEVTNYFDSLVPKEAFNLDMKNLLKRVKEYKDFSKTEDDLKRETKFKISCEAEEGRFMLSQESPFSNGNFILVPLEFPERYVFFEILAPNFQKRLASIIKPYPWRMDADNLRYEM